MASNSVLRWLDGSGWLVLAGSDNNDDIRAQALGRVAADGVVAYVMTSKSSQLYAEQTLADMDDLGAPPGYLVDALTEDDETVRQRLGEAGMVVIGGDDDIDMLRSVLLGAAAAGIQDAFLNGAVVLAQGTAAMLFGEWVLDDAGVVNSGLGWLERAIVIPAITRVAVDARAQALLNAQPNALAIGIGAGSALALGPGGEVETWGEQEVTVALGPDYSA